MRDIGIGYLVGCLLHIHYQVSYVADRTPFPTFLSLVCSFCLSLEYIFVYFLLHFNNVVFNDITFFKKK